MPLPGPFWDNFWLDFWAIWEPLSLFLWRCFLGKTLFYLHGSSFSESFYGFSCFFAVGGHFKNNSFTRTGARFSRTCFRFRRLFFIPKILEKGGFLSGSLLECFFYFCSTWNVVEAAPQARSKTTWIAGNVDVVCFACSFHVLPLLGFVKLSLLAVYFMG